MRISVSTLPILLTFIFINLLNTASAQNNEVAPSILQNGKEFKITGDNRNITLKKDEFKILFNSLAYTEKKEDATQIDAFFVAKGTTMIHTGIKIDSISYFSGGTGMAANKDKEYDCLYIDKDFSQHHYIIFMENTDRRAKLESRNGDTLRLSWTIKKFSLDDKKEISIKKIESNELYLVILNDFNMNGIVDEGEYSIIHITFE